MRDGVRLAVEVYVPKGLQSGERTATILQMTRYYRAVRIRPWARILFPLLPDTITEQKLRTTSVKAGYSWVDVDVRGTGASFGQQQFGTSENEIRDVGDIMDWIVAQPWSAGVVGTTGLSYNGTLAVAALQTRHPALKAVASRFGAWDLYEDVFKPGGLTVWPMLEALRRLGVVIDDGKIEEAGLFARLVSTGAKPVDSDLLPKAIADHAGNIDAERIISAMDFRDEHIQGGPSLDQLSPATTVGNQSRVPVYAISGWFDGAMVPGQLRQFMANRHPGSELRLGPWFHSGTFNGSPYAASRKNDFNYVPEVLAFFDRELRGVKTAPRRGPITYFTMGEERWKTTATWPPPGGESKTLFLASGNVLRDHADDGDGIDEIHVVPMSISPVGGRWGLAAVSKVRKGYEDQRPVHERMLTYTSAPLERALEITGAPRVTLYLSLNLADGPVFVHLGEVAPDGQVRYVTEGLLRLSHRKLAPSATGLSSLHSFRAADVEWFEPNTVTEVVLDMLPVSYRIPSGHALRVAIGGSDFGVFRTAPYDPPAIYAVHHGQMRQSRIEFLTYR